LSFVFVFPKAWLLSMRKRQIRLETSSTNKKTAQLQRL
jgi:hypothetical protein